MTVDCTIGHITQPDDNLFLDLGFSPEEATRLHALSQREINDMVRLKEQLMAELNGWIRMNALKQEQAARVLCVSRPRVSDVVNRKTSKFTLDALIEMLSRVGKSVTISVG